ncbi:MAG: hypothetical protein JSU58_04630 [Dehalococcoidales bacterium]|nr:MAG: hypothetical protein JSU58_04630 [Dehalococcoidales bacterium]
MLVKEAKEVAWRWVIEEASRLPGFHGALYSGSVNWLSDDAVIPETSDVDIWIVFTGSDPPASPGKLLSRDVILDVAYLQKGHFQSPDTILSDYHLAGAFRTPNVILDPSGQLTQFQKAVSTQYARRHWVYRRCEDAKNHSLNYARLLTKQTTFPQQVSFWIFATGVTTHILLTAGLKNPTVRTRYLAVRELLIEYGHLEFYETLLEMLGCTGIDRALVEHHLAALTAVFDAAKAVIKTPIPQSSDISDPGRSVAIDGSWELIENGNHREVIFWMVVTYARCQWILNNDATAELQKIFSPGFYELLADLGITSYEDLRQRTKRIEDFIPQVWTRAEAIISANPAIED